MLAVKIRYKCTYTEIFGGEQKKTQKVEGGAFRL
jgi:hypothetical protein